MKSYNFELEERLTTFSENVVRLCRKLPQDAVNRRPIDQVVGASGSTTANYFEACESESGKDFIHKIKIAKKEVRESKFWLRLLGVRMFEL